MQAARAPVEPRPRPDLAPRVPGDELLELAREIGRPRRRGVDVRVAEHLAAHPHAALVPVVAHPASPARCSSTAAGERRRLPGAREVGAVLEDDERRARRSPSAIALPCSGGATESSAAERTSVGAAIRPRSALASHSDERLAAAGVPLAVDGAERGPEARDDVGLRRRERGREPAAEHRVDHRPPCRRRGRPPPAPATSRAWRTGCRRTRSRAGPRGRARWRRSTWRPRRRSRGRTPTRARARAGRAARARRPRAPRWCTAPAARACRRGRAGRSGRAGAGPPAGRPAAPTGRAPSRASSRAGAACPRRRSGGAPSRVASVPAARTVPSARSTSAPAEPR